MDQDSPMLDGPTSSQQIAEEKRTAGSWNTKKWQEDYAMFQSRLVDKSFKASNYPDPLGPRTGVPVKYNVKFPDGTGERLKAVIAKVENKA